MEKILVGVHLSAMNLKYDMFVPADMPIGQMVTIITTAVTELTGGKYESSGLEMLSLTDPSRLLNPSLTLLDYQAKDGTQLYLI